jgi:hypothetical protein
VAGRALTRRLRDHLRASDAISGRLQFRRECGDPAAGWEAGGVEVAMARESFVSCVVIQITGCRARGRLDGYRVAIPHTAFGVHTEG